jgi:hypothetical protein
VTDSFAHLRWSVARSTRTIGDATFGPFATPPFLDHSRWRSKDSVGAGLASPCAVPPPPLDNDQAVALEISNRFTNVSEPQPSHFGKPSLANLNHSQPGRIEHRHPHGYRCTAQPCHGMHHEFPVQLQCHFHRLSSGCTWPLTTGTVTPTRSVTDFTTDFGLFTASGNWLAVGMIELSTDRNDARPATRAAIYLRM